MGAIEERIAQDLQKFSSLSAQTDGRVRVVGTAGNPTRRIDVELHYRTAPSRDYPRKVQEVTTVRIELMSRYPFVEPSAVITTPIFHPNVFPSGKICLGTKWLPSQGLDLLIRRVIQILTFDPTVLNERSPANGHAVDWYRSAVCANTRGRSLVHRTDVRTTICCPYRSHGRSFFVPPGFQSDRPHVYHQVP